MSHGEFAPADKTIRPPEIIRARMRNRVLESIKKFNDEKKLIKDFALVDDAEEFRRLKGIRDCRILAGETPPLSMKIIALATAQHFGVTYANMKGKIRVRDVVMTRQLANYLIKTMTGNTYPAIGIFFNRHHTTAIHGVQKIEALVASGDEEVIGAIKAIMEAIEP